MNLPEELISVFPELFSLFLEESDDMAFALLDMNLEVSHCNGCFREMLEGGGTCRGKNFSRFLSPEEIRLFDMEDGESVTAWLTFIPEGLFGTALRGRIYRRGGWFLLLGSVLRTDDSEIFGKISMLANEMTNISRDLKRKNRELREARTRIETLSGIIPICMYCKEIRDDEGYWNNLETFISQHSSAEFSHSICSKCAKKHFPETSG